MDITILKFLNSLAGKSVYLDAVFIFLAVYFIFALAGVHLIYFWRMRRLDLWFWSIATAVAAYSTKIIIGFLHFRFRPFIMDGINKLIDKSSTEASFPSGHTLISFALAFGVFWFHPHTNTKRLQELKKDLASAKSFKNRLRARLKIIGVGVNRKWGALFLVGAFLVGISRIIVGVHYPSDILAGILIAFLLSLIIKKLEIRN